MDSILAIPVTLVLIILAIAAVMLIGTLLVYALPAIIGFWIVCGVFRAVGH